MKLNLSHGVLIGIIALVFLIVSFFNFKKGNYVSGVIMLLLGGGMFWMAFGARR